MKSKAFAAFLWIQVALAASCMLLMFYSQLTRPAMQIEFSRKTGVVSAVTAGGPSDRAGVRVGDRIISIAGNGVRPGMVTLFFERAGEAVPAEIERDGERLNLSIIPETLEETRRAALRSGGGSAMWAFAGYLSFPLHLWMFALGVTLLALRFDNGDARVSALALVYWCGGTFLFEMPGMGAVLQSMPAPLRGAVYLLDSAFIALFFAACVHFAMIFPLESTRRPRTAWQLLPYLVVVPIFVEAALEATGRISRSTQAVSNGSPVYTTLGPVLLVVALVILMVRFRGTRDLNARRRLALVFLALLPGVLGFIFSVLLTKLNAGYTWIQFGRVVNFIGTAAGSAIYAYAVVRHRMYDIRVLVRRSLQYALARGTLLFLMALPLVALGAFLYAHRAESLQNLITGEPATYLLLLVPIALVIAYRKRLLDAVDRRFFREQYDARRLLLQVVSMVREGSDTFTVTRIALDEIDSALHPKHISLWQVDAEGREFQRGLYRGEAPPHAVPIGAGGALPTLLAGMDEPLDLYARANRTLVQRLPPGERAWLEKNDAYLLVPLLIEQRLGGLMLLGERMSEEPYSREDRELLRMLAAQLALTIDYSRLKQSPGLVWNASQTQAPPLVAKEILVRSCPTCGRCFAAPQERCDVDSSPLADEEGVPHTIEDKYVLTRVIGRGGMGSVFQATQVRLNRPVAIKVLLSHLVGSTTMRGRFEREARIVARLKHPSIVTVHDFGVLDSGHAYLVMEYLDGQTLRKTVRDGAQPLEAVIPIVSAMGDAIDSAHRAGVVHRDLKPENVMLVRGHDGGALLPRVLDFGLAKMSGPLQDDEATQVQTTKSAGVVGTLLYMAPEVLSGFPADALADQYSLALIVYELLCGVHPFGGATDLASIVRGHTAEEPPALSKRAPHLPVAVTEAVHRALAKDAMMRFPSVAAFVAALRAGR